MTPLSNATERNDLADTSNANKATEEMATKNHAPNINLNSKDVALRITGMKTKHMTKR